ncbi:glycosyltransferase [Opitutus sp. ER46]|uniref:glycosyltransferase family protein n=1 Tax=Opitutus sp. ER46 TaxID=2161864 RepID=UPI000D315B00|nr:glycosyltransferase [Opitutus sp. ER46]PTX91100.1 hypothetical protein DB354_20920 [Opitutus sp. ER46]
MRIFTAVRHSNDPRHFYGGLWSGLFHPALHALGHQLVESQTDLLPTSRFMEIAAGFTREELEARARTTQAVLDEVRDALRTGPIDLFLCYFYNAHFDPAGFAELRRLGIPSVNFYCNSIPQFDLVAAIAAQVDFSWHSERDARDRYLAVGGRPVWVQLAVNPPDQEPPVSRPRQPRACFVGQRYADRDRWIAGLLAAGVTVDTYGSGWGDESPLPASPSPSSPGRYLGRPQLRAGSMRSYWHVVTDEITRTGLLRGAARLYRQWNYRRESQRISPLLRSCARGRADVVAAVFADYEVVLNFSNVWSDGRPGSRLVPHVRLRDFEAPMARTCYLTGHSDEIAACYDVGREIETYRTPEELADKVRYYLSHPDQAERMREAGYRRARRDHTWGQRFPDLFRQIGLTRPAQGRT